MSAAQSTSPSATTSTHDECSSHITLERLSESSIQKLPECVLKTLLYADVFHFPLTEIEITHFLIGGTATVSEVHHTLHHSSQLANQITQQGDYYRLYQSDAPPTDRHKREINSRLLWRHAVRFGAILARIPFVRMVALTGSLAVHNAYHARDDIDYLIVTEPGRVWTVRAFAVLLVRAARIGGIKLCPNYVLDTESLVQDRRDLFIAHEIAQMIPLSGFDVYRQMRDLNRWTDAYLPNAQTPLYSEPDHAPKRQYGERLLRSRVASRVTDAFEQWEYRRKQRKFTRGAPNPGAAKINAKQVKGHFNDHGVTILQAYYERLKRYGLERED
jgi:hypothetical protein